MSRVRAGGALSLRFPQAGFGVRDRRGTLGDSLARSVQSLLILGKRRPRLSQATLGLALSFQQAKLGLGSGGEEVDGSFPGIGIDVSSGHFVSFG